jgi:phenylalanyl-tRNA synthetase alpha chain
MEAGSKRLFSTPETEKKEKKPRDFEKYWQDVKKVHQEGAFGSIGCMQTLDPISNLKPY